MDDKDNSVATYDFVQSGHKLNKQWPIFDLVSNRVATEFGTNLTSRLQVLIEGQASESTKAMSKQCVVDMGNTAVVNEMALAPLPGFIWFYLDISVLSALVNCYFGGNAELEKLENARSLSRTEQKVMHHIIDALNASLIKGWSMLMTLQPEYVRQLAYDRLSTTAMEQVMLVSHIALKVGEIDLPCQIAYPFDTLRPLNERLQHEKSATPKFDANFSNAMQKEIMNCELDIRGVLAESKITLGTLLELKPGDFIPLRDIETVSFKTENIPLFDAQVGNSNGRVSASLSRWHLPTST
ncbi:MAG: FliM/FliN family flagellar motor switch protein [Granulosicoccus sp.]